MSATAEQARTPQIAHLSADTPVEEIFAVYERDRTLIIDELADPQTLGELRTQLDAVLSATPESAREDDYLGMKTKRAGALITRVPACRPFVTHPLILELAERILSKTGSTIQFNTSQAMAVLPGETRQALHRDRWIWQDLPLPANFEHMIACMWAVSDFTAASGATHVLPGSLELPDPPSIDDIYAGKEARLPDGTALASLTTAQAEMRPGSVLIYSGSVYHGAGANSTDCARLGLSLSYIPASLRQEENQYLVTPPEVARELPKELQELLGYELGNYVLGFVDDMKSPMTLLR